MLRVWCPCSCLFANSNGPCWNRGFHKSTATLTSCDMALSTQLRIVRVSIIPSHRPLISNFSCPHRAKRTRLQLQPTGNSTQCKRPYSKANSCQTSEHISTFNGTRKFITAFTTARYWCIFWSKLILPAPCYNISVRCILDLFSHYVH